MRSTDQTHGCILPWSSVQKSDSVAPNKKIVLVHRLEVDIAAYLQGSGLSALQENELKAAVAKQRQVDLQVSIPCHAQLSMQFLADMCVCIVLLSHVLSKLQHIHISVVEMNVRPVMTCWVCL